MKVLQINAVYGIGSTGKIVRDISDALIEFGHESYVMWATGCRVREKKEEAKLIRIGNTLDHKLHALLRRVDGGQGMHSKFATKRLCKRILEISPDVVHLHNLHSNYVNTPMLFDFLAKHDIPTLITLHDCWLMSGYCTHYINYGCDKWQHGCVNCPAVKNRLKKSVEKRFLKRREIYSKMNCLAVNGVSKWTAEAAKASILKKANYIDHIYNWVDTDLYKPQNNLEAVREKYGVRQNAKLILGVSQLWCKEKGIDSFVAIADKFFNTADVILVGNATGMPERENLHYIGFTESVDDLIDLYSAADVLVNASNAETFGLVTVEAMACGTPVVAYDNTGSAELVDEHVGMLVKNGDVRALISGVPEILEKGKEYYKSSCREYACKNFSKNSQIQKYIELYQKISSKSFDANKEC